MKKTRYCVVFIILLLVLCALPVLGFCAQEKPEWDTGDFLFSDVEYFSEPKGEAGPWLYESDNISITVTRCKAATGHRYAVADIRLRNGESFYSGAGYGSIALHKTEMPYRMARRYDAVFGFTGDYLTHSGNPKGVMIREGKVYYDKKDMDMMCIYPDGVMEVYPKGSVTADELLAKGAVDVYAFGPILLMDGEFYKPAKEHMVATNNRRCSIGMIEPGHFIVLSSTSGFPVEPLANIFASYGCTVAYNMDGGHSATMILMGEQLNSQPYNELMDTFQRALPDMVLLGHSELVPDIDDPVRYKDIETGTKKPAATATPVPTPTSSAPTADNTADAPTNNPNSTDGT